MSPKGWLIVIILALASSVGLYISGKHAGRDQEQAKTASIIAATANHVADSIALVYAQRFDSAKNATARTIAQKDAAVNVAARQTNQATAAANDAVVKAEALLADSAATLAQLRGALQADNAVIDSMGIAFEAERETSRQARAARDSVHAQEIALLRGGFDATLKAKAEAAVAVGKAFAARVE